MATKNHCAYCFDVLVYHFEKKKLPPPPFPNDSYPLFVTWHKQETPNEELSLRGCIGTFSAKQIHLGLQDYALISALKDSRFSPVVLNELPTLHCAVSLLCDFEDCDLWDWEIGKHGIIIDFKDRKGRSLNGTYLPEVAEEQGWTKEKTVRSLIRKAGFKGSVTEELLETLKVTRYRSSKSEISYVEYLSLRR